MFSSTLYTSAYYSNSKWGTLSCMSHQHVWVFSTQRGRVQRPFNFWEDITEFNFWENITGITKDLKSPQTGLHFFLRLRGQTMAPAKEGKPSLAWVCTCVCVWGRWRRAHPSSSWWSYARSRWGSRPSSSGTTAAARPWPTSPHCCLTPRLWCPGSVARENICWVFVLFFI